MLALCLMLSGIYYAQNYASIIGWCLMYMVGLTEPLQGMVASFCSVKMVSITAVLIPIKNFSLCNNVLCLSELKPLM